MRIFKYWGGLRGFANNRLFFCRLKRWFVMRDRYGLNTLRVVRRLILFKTFASCATVMALNTSVLWRRFFKHVFVVCGGGLFHATPVPITPVWRLVMLLIIVMQAKRIRRWCDVQAQRMSNFFVFQTLQHLICYKFIMHYAEKCSWIVVPVE